MIKVVMLIICMVPVNSTLQEAWRIEETVSLEHCLKMNQIISGAGPAAAIIVECNST